MKFSSPIISLLLGTLLLLPLGVHAQEAAAEEPRQDEAAADANEEAAEPDPAPPPANERSPFEYEASEQISEDLSVSFPVDI